MIKTGVLLAAILVTACAPSTTIKPLQTEETISASSNTTIQWVENNLTPLHSIDTQVKRSSIPQLMALDKIPGLSIAFVEQGKVSWTQSYGYANLETLEKVTEKTVFTGASLSKPLTAMAALNFVEAGKLSLDTDVNQVLKDWQIAENEFTNNEKVTCFTGSYPRNRLKSIKTSRIIVL